MEVSTVQDKITHAVVGGQKMVDFQISDDAEFYHLLSNALYSKKPMAVVREVLCNAWDAHIDSGNTHLPVKVTIEDGMMIIRDYGKGISKDNIGPVYCIYGGSDKKKNGNVTGGFGLGAKAPFAITEHFEVTSHHEGEKTIYRMSLSHAVAGGKPSCIPIMSLPTDETGLEVKIKLPEDDYEDDYAYMDLVKFVTYYGQMKVELNGEELPILTQPAKGQNFVIIPVGSIPASKVDRSRLYIRYGNVIYPVQDNRVFEHKFQQLKDFLAYSKSSYYSNIEWSVILFAEPNSIAVTPSRESLSMTERTSNTILNLINGFLGSCLINEEKFNQELLEKHYSNGFNVLFPKNLLNYDEPAKNWIKQNLQVLSVEEITSFEDFFTLKYVNSNNHHKEDYLRRDMTLRAQSLLNYGVGRKHIVQKYINHINTSMIHRECYDWFVKNLVKPLVKKGVGIINKNDLYVYNGHSFGDDKLMKLDDFYVDAQKLLGFLSNTVILTPLKRGIREKLHFRKEMYHWYGHRNDTFAYYMPKSDAARQKIRDYFNSLDVVVIDLTVRSKWDLPPVKRERKPKPEVPVEKIIGYPKLSYIYVNTYTCNSNYTPSDNSERITDPEYYVVLPYTKHGNAKPDSFSNTEFANFVKVYGEKGVYVRTWKTVQASTELSALPTIDDYLKTKLEDSIVNNPDLIEYISINNYKSDRSGNALLTTLLGCKQIRDKYKVKIEWTDEVKYLGDMIINFTSYEKRHQYPEVQKHTEKIPIHSGLNDLVQTVEKSKLIELLDAFEVRRALSSVDKKLKTDTETLLFLLLES
jgi:hypothetical protein